VTQLQKRQYEVLPFISFGQVFQPIAYRKNLDGVLRSPSSFYWNISKK
jgi:peptide/nickel transport system substrate-binding protein